MLLRIAGAALIALAFVACGDDDEGPAPPVAETFSANLTGAAERPNPVTTTATGTATFTKSLTDNTITFSVTVNGLTGTLTGAHIHGPADVNTATGIINGFTLNGASSGVIASGSWTTPTAAAVSQDSLLKLMRTGLAYVNVHTSVNPGGQIRGQITQP